MESTRTERRACRFGLGCMLAAFLAAVVLAATGAGDAHAKSVRFWATFKADKTIRWAEPKWYGHTDCYHRWWSSAQGRQTETYRSTMPIRVLIYTGGLTSQSTFIKWRTWSEYGESATRHMPGEGVISRSASRATDWEAGTCGVRGVIIDDEGRERTTPVPPEPQDCKTTRPAVDANMYLGSKTAELSIGSAGADQDDLMGSYRACEIATPYEMDEYRWGSEVSSVVPRAALFNSDLPQVVFSGRHDYHQKWFVGGMHGLVFATGSVRWTVTFRRATIPVITGRKRRR